MAKTISGAIALTALAFAALGARASDQSALAWSSAWSVGHNSKIRLVAMRLPMAPEAGSTAPAAARYLAGIEIALAPQWKTYWRNPGDAGVPPSFDLAASENVASAKVLYPAPTRFPDKSGDAIGYKGTVIFPVEITAKDLAKPIVLAIKAEYGVCLDICIPAEADLKLVVGTDSGLADLATRLAIIQPLAESFARVPRALQHALPSAPRLKATEDLRTATTPKFIVTANFKGAANPQVYIEAPDSLYVPLARKVADAADGSARFEVDLSKGIDLADFNGKTLRVTIVSDAGAIEAEWLLK